MSTLIEVKVPEGDEYKESVVIEVHVKPGAIVQAMDSLVTLESGKASVDIPSPAAGVIRALKLKLGDNATEGSVIAMLEVEGAG